MKAIDELEKCQHKELMDMQQLNYVKVPAEAPNTDDDDEIEDEKPEVNDPWKISKATADNIPTDIMDIITPVCPGSLEEEDYEDVITTLASAANEKLSRVYEGVDDDDVIQIGHLLNSAKSPDPDLPEADENVSLSAALSALGSFTRKKPEITLLPDPGRTIGKIRPLGIGDLKVVKQKLLKYEEGELAHIENVMAGETRNRTHRTLERVEDFQETESESSEKTINDLQTTDRFELQKETQKTIETDMSLNAGLTVSAKYGPVEVGANAGFSLNQSRQQSTQTSSNYARDVTTRSLKEVEKKVREKRSVTKISEVEDTNFHGFTGGTDHIVGLYQWVDKLYEAQVYNYGMRMMFEFMIPEPAAFYIHANKSKLTEGVTLKKPKTPKRLSPKTISPSNYRYFVKKYNVQGITPPPDRVKIIGNHLRCNRNRRRQQQAGRCRRHLHPSEL